MNLEISVKEESGNRVCLLATAPLFRVSYRYIYQMLSRHCKFKLRGTVSQKPIAIKRLNFTWTPKKLECIGVDVDLLLWLLILFCSGVTCSRKKILKLQSKLNIKILLHSLEIITICRPSFCLFHWQSYLISFDKHIGSKAEEYNWQKSVTTQL